MPTKVYSQYVEEEILVPFFKEQRTGLVVDVGAGDGVTFSNSRMLLESGWSGVLIEPEPEQFRQLWDLYHGDVRVCALQYAVAEVAGEFDFWPWAMGSTMSPEWRDRFPRGTYGHPIKVNAKPLSQLLVRPILPGEVIDFLSIDCEGLDLEVLRSHDWKRNPVRLVCVESGGVDKVGEPSCDYLRGIGMVYHARTHGNTFWRNANAP